MEDPEYDFLNTPEIDADIETSQSQPGNTQEMSEAGISIPDSQVDTITALINHPKHKSYGSQEKENHPPIHPRRTAAPDTTLSRKPISLADVQTSVMELLDDPRIMVPDSQYSDSESDNEAMIKPAGHKPVIDRLTLSRTTSMDPESSTANNMAFHTPSASVVPGFKIPSLLRRATSNLSAVERTSEKGSMPTESIVRRGGTGRSNIHAQAREAERRATLEKRDEKRKEGIRKKIKAKGKRSVLKDLGGGFE